MVDSRENDSDAEIAFVVTETLPVSVNLQDVQWTVGEGRRGSNPSNEWRSTHRDPPRTGQPPGRTVGGRGGKEG